MKKNLYFNFCSFSSEDIATARQDNKRSIGERLHTLVTKLAYLEVQHQFGDSDMSDVFAVVEELNDLRAEYEDAVEKVREEANKLGLNIE